MKKMKYTPNTLAKHAAIFGISAAFCGLTHLSAQSFSNDFEDFSGTDEENLGNPVFLDDSGSGYNVTQLTSTGNPFSTAALRVVDRTNVTAPSAEWELSSAVSAAAISLDFHVRDADNNTAPILFAVGPRTGNNAKELNSSGNRLTTLNLNSDGTALFQAKGASNLSQSINIDSANSGDSQFFYNVDFFINDFNSQSITYTNPETGLSSSLAANSVVFYLDNTLVGTSTLSGTVGGADVGTTEGNIGRFGFAGFGGNEGIVAHFDNLSVSAVPEPATYALLFGTLALGLTALRRRTR